MRRMHATDVALLDAAVEKLTEAKTVLKEIDLRTYGGDDELKQTLNEARLEAQAAINACRAARRMEWSR